MKREGFGGKVFKLILFMLEKFAVRYEPVILDLPFDGKEEKEIVKGIKIINTPGHSMAAFLIFVRVKMQYSPVML